MDEAQYLAHRVAVIAKGRIVAEGPPQTLSGRERMRTKVRFRLPAGASPVPDWGQTAQPDGGFELLAEDPTRPLHDLTGWALERGVSLEALEVTRPSLEDIYIELTGGEEGTE
jgi:ABC-2 type transport system ATP-binding protein